MEMERVWGGFKDDMRRVERGFVDRDREDMRKI